MGLGTCSTLRCMSGCSKEQSRRAAAWWCWGGAIVVAQEHLCTFEGCCLAAHEPSLLPGLDATPSSRVFRGTTSATPLLRSGYTLYDLHRP